MEGKPKRAIVVLVGALLAASVCFQLVPGDTLAGSLVQGALLAGLAVGAVALCDRETLALRRPVSGVRRSEVGERSSEMKEHGAELNVRRPKLRVQRSALVLQPARDSRGSAIRERQAATDAVEEQQSEPNVCRGLRWVIYVLVVGLVAGVVASWRVEPAAVTDGPLMVRVVVVVLICLLTGVFEEGIFRATALRAFIPAFEGSRAPLLKAALASSVLFGFLHVSAADAVAAGSAVAWAQVVCKPLQAALFGLVMTALFIRTRSLWTASLAHGLFNVVYVGPLMLLAGVQTTYVTGDPFDLALLAATTLLLIPPATASYRSLASSSAGA